MSEGLELKWFIPAGFRICIQNAFGPTAVQRMWALGFRNPSLNIPKISFLNYNLFKSVQFVHSQTDTFTYGCAAIRELVWSRRNVAMST